MRAHGKSRPVEAWQPLEALSGLPAQPTDDDLPLVGRAEERDLLIAELDRALGEPRTTLVTVLGEPGIGKSRLLREFVAVVRRRPETITVRQGRSLAYGDGIAFWALGEMVKQHAGIAPADSSSAAKEKLRAAVADAIHDGRQRPSVERHLRPLVGLDPDGPGGRVEAFAAWRRFFEALAEHGPLGARLEDLHWADDALLDFVELLVDRGGGLPLLIICTSRSDLLARRRGWEAGGRVMVELGPMVDRETRGMLAGLLGGSEVPEDVGGSVLAASAGNPLFVREYVGMLRDTGALQEGPRGWELVTPVEGIPDSVQSVIAARIDTPLFPAERAFIQDASVVGRRAALSAV